MKKHIKLRTIVASNIRSIRLKQSLSQEKLAELTGLHRTYISSIERSKRNITIDSIEKLTTALNINVQELLIADETTY